MSNKEQTETTMKHDNNKY